MKKLFTLAAAAMLIVALSATAMAYDQGDIVFEDEDDDFEEVTSLVPGKKYYVILVGEDDYDSNEKPKSVKWSNIEVDDPNEDESFEGSKAKRYAALSSSPIRLKVGSGTTKYAWGAKLDAKTVKASDYDDSIDVSGTIEFRLDNTDEEFDTSFSIEYEDGGNELTDDEQIYEFDRNDDVDIDLPDGDGSLTGVANKDFKLIASMNTDYNSTIGNKYPNANLDFYNGNGVSLTYIKNARLRFEAGSDRYLYEITDGNKLVDLTNTYDKGKGEFVVSARSLGKYVVSNRKLDASSAVSSPASSSSTGGNTGGGTTTGNTSLDQLNGLIQRNFSNKFTLLSYGSEYGVLPKAVSFSVSVSLSGMNTNDLYLYTYDAANNRLIGSANKPKVGADGKLSFTTNTKGYYVVSSGQLAK